MLAEALDVRLLHGEAVVALGDAVEERGIHGDGGIDLLTVPEDNDLRGLASPVGFAAEKSEE